MAEHNVQQAREDLRREMVSASEMKLKSSIGEKGPISDVEFARLRARLVQ
jgi:hypothetical protein